MDIKDIAEKLDRSVHAVRNQIAMHGMTLTPLAILARRARGIHRGRRPKHANA